MPPSAGLAGALHAPLLKAALRLQRRFRAHRARKAVLARRGARFAESALPSATWVAAEDPRSGTRYWFHRGTGAITYARPEAFAEAEARHHSAQVDALSEVLREEPDDVEARRTAAAGSDEEERTFERSRSSTLTTI